MKIFFIAWFFLCMAAISQASEQNITVYDGVVLTEDTTWRGSILVRGYVVVAPQATLRIEPGTIVRFRASDNKHPANLVVQGRIHAAGTIGMPIVLSADRASLVRGSWGGIVLLSTEKRNLLEQCRIEYAETGINVQFSTVALKSVSITQCRTAVRAHDGVIQITGGILSDSETGLEVYNSEFDGRDIIIKSCRRGSAFNKSAVVLATVNIINNQHIGLDAEECRVKITGCEFSANGLGARIKGGEGQISVCSFLRNRQTALQLSSSSMKIQRCLFTDNFQDALRVEDGRALLLSNAFGSNGGFNLFNAGQESVNALLNWWGTTDAMQIAQKINDSVRDKNAGSVNISPWLDKKPLLMP